MLYYLCVNQIEKRMLIHCVKAGHQPQLAEISLEGNNLKVRLIEYLPLSHEQVSFVINRYEVTHP